METLVKAEKSKINKRYAAIYNLLVKDFNKYVGNFSDAELIGTYKYIHGKNVCNEKKLRDIEEGTAAYDDIIDQIKNEDLFDDISMKTDEVISKHPIKEYSVCIGQNEPEKVVSTPIGEHTKTVDCKETDSNNFNVNKVRETHCAKLHGEPFCVTGKDLDSIDIDDLF